MEDFCDGQYFKQHPVFKDDPNALQFIIYYDDIEVANPLELPFDIMHTIFEGVANFHLTHLLPHLIDKKHYFTLDQSNNIIQAHEYGYSERDTKPSTIQFKSNGYNIKQSGIVLSLIHYIHVLTHSITDDDFNSTPSFYGWDIC